MTASQGQSHATQPSRKANIFLQSSSLRLAGINVDISSFFSGKISNNLLIQILKLFLSNRQLINTRTDVKILKHTRREEIFYRIKSKYKVKKLKAKKQSDNRHFHKVVIIRMGWADTEEVEVVEAGGRRNHQYGKGRRTGGPDSR